MHTRHHQEEEPSIFKVVEEIANAGNDEYSDMNERLVAEFFSGVIPLYSYLCFFGQWCGYFKVDRIAFDKLFLEHFAETHANYHKNKGGE